MTSPRHANHVVGGVKREEVPGSLSFRALAVGLEEAELFGAGGVLRERFPDNSTSWSRSPHLNQLRRDGTCGPLAVPQPDAAVTLATFNLPLMPMFVGCATETNGVSGPQANFFKAGTHILRKSQIW